MIVTTVTVRVPAKINLQLTVGPLRDDGYHGLVTVFHAVSLFDEVAGGVGSDVAFAVLGGTAVGRGRGEQLTSALVAPATYHWVLAFADGNLSTPAVYGTLDRLRGDAAVSEPELSAELMTALRAG